MKHLFKRVLLTILFLTAAGIGNAQSKHYESYFGQDSTVLTLYQVPYEIADVDHNITIKFYNGDTIKINGNLYNYGVIDYYLATDTVFLREDRNTGQLFRFYRTYPMTMEPNVERKCCDMSLEIGDSIVFPPVDFYETVAVVTDVSFDAFGKKSLQLITTSGDLPPFVITEGVFSPEFPLYQQTWEGAPGYSMLLCADKDSVNIYASPYGCELHLFQLDETKTGDLTIFPNPVKATNGFSVVSEEEILDLRLFDQLGRTVNVTMSSSMDNNCQVEMKQQLEQGFYMLFIKTKKGKYYEKIVVTN